jgi:hypothetical protein
MAQTGAIEHHQSSAIINRCVQKLIELSGSRLADIAMGSDDNKVVV